MVIALVAVYKFKPQLFKGIIPVKNDTTAIKPVVVKKDTAATQLPADTAAKDTVAKPDTTTIKQKVAPPVTKPVVTAPVTTAPVTTTAISDTSVVAKGSWVIYHGAFPTRKTAEKQVDHDKGNGFATARLLSNKVKGNGLYKAILGVYPDKVTATSRSQDFIASGKIKKTDISIEQVK